MLFIVALHCECEAATAELTRRQSRRRAIVDVLDVFLQRIVPGEGFGAERAPPWLLVAFIRAWELISGIPRYLRVARCSGIYSLTLPSTDTARLEWFVNAGVPSAKGDIESSRMAGRRERRAISNFSSELRCTSSKWILNCWYELKISGQAGHSTLLLLSSSVEVAGR